MNRIYHPSEKKPNKRPNKQTNDTKTRTSTCLQHIFDILCLNLQEHSFVNIFKTFLLTFLLEIEYKKNEMQDEQSQCYIVLWQEIVYSKIKSNSVEQRN